METKVFKIGKGKAKHCGYRLDGGEEFQPYCDNWHIREKGSNNVEDDISPDNITCGVCKSRREFHIFVDKENHDMRKSLVAIDEVKLSKFKKDIQLPVSDSTRKFIEGEIKALESSIKNYKEKIDEYEKTQNR